MSYALDQIAGFAPPTETLSLKDFLKSDWEALPVRQGRIPGETEMRNMSSKLVPRRPIIRSKKFDVSRNGVSSLVSYVQSMLPKGHKFEVTVETHSRRLNVTFYYAGIKRMFSSNKNEFKVATCVPRSIAKSYRGVSA